MALFTSCQSDKKQEMNQKPIAYPTTQKDTTVFDTYFNTKVADPYRWLEADTSAQTKAWVTAQNKVTFDYLA